MRISSAGVSTSVRHFGGNSQQLFFMKTNYILSTIILTTILTARASACDLCACDLPLIRLDNRSGWHAGVSEQYTSYESLRLDGRDIKNPSGQYLHSSITQIMLGYDFQQRFGVQLNVPLIARTYRRVEEGRVENGSISGIGDISLIAHYTPVRVERGDFLFTARLMGGIKFPTGDSDRLKEEAAHGHDTEEDGHEADASHEEEATAGHEHEAHEPAEHEHEEETHADEESSGVHGHDLALGTGSVDFIVGGDMHLQWKRLFVNAGVQVTVRGQGRHDYDFADDVAWHAGLGAVVFKGKELAVALEARIAGESKGEDKFQGQRLDDTAATNVYFGPHAVVTWTDRLSVDAGFGFPIQRENTGTQVTPDIRFQAAVSWHF